jgi:hypothetical protein
MLTGTSRAGSPRPGFLRTGSLRAEFYRIVRSCLLFPIALAALLSVAALAARQFVMPVPHTAKTYPAHEEHSDESVTVAFDPYDMADKAAIFSVHYNEMGMLPVFVVITNDGDQPVSLAAMETEFITVNRAKIAPASADDLYRRLARPEASTKPSPIPWPKKAKAAVSKQAQEEIQDAQFAARAVEPHATQAGFMFFDVSGISTPLAGAHIYLTGLRDAKGHDLFYFDVPMEKYLSAPAKP